MFPHGDTGWHLQMPQVQNPTPNPDLMSAQQQQLEEFTARNNYGSNVVVVVSDAAGEAAKARRLVQLALPQIISLNCFPHQTNLIVAGTCNLSSNATTPPQQHRR